MPDFPTPPDWSQVESRLRHRLKREFKRASQPADRDQLLGQIQASATRVATRRAPSQRCS